MSVTSNPSSAHPSSLPQHGRRSMERQQNAASDGASPWMWATLVALLIVVPSWWWARHSDESLAPVTRRLPAGSRQIRPPTDGPR
ncbi:cell envelope biogenesis protein TonB, partial [Xanthomonas perforans]